jgi:hypothetical protein
MMNTLIENRKLLLILSLFLLLEQSNCEELIIPLAYAYDPATKNKYNIKLSFDDSETFLPFSANYVPLFNFNISMETQRFANNETQFVIIGLKSPSSFIAAVMSTFKVSARQIEFGKEEYTQLIINGNNFVESRDEFINGDYYTVKAFYNYGDPLYKSEQRCFLVDDENVYFDEFLILEILNSMEPKNGIRYEQDESERVINLMGNTENFPKVSFILGKYIFETDIQTDQIHYIPRSNSSESTTIIGFRALKKFSKFEVIGDVIAFKRTLQLYQLYMFLAYFFLYTIAFLVISRSKLEESMLFVRSIINWIVFHNRQARLRVLRTEL